MKESRGYHSHLQVTKGPNCLAAEAHTYNREQGLVLPSLHIPVT